MSANDHKLAKILNGLLRRWGLQELTQYEADTLVLHYLLRHNELSEMCAPLQKSAMPINYLRAMMEVGRMLTEEMLDLLFTLRGVEGIYCLQGRRYHES